MRFWSAKKVFLRGQCTKIKIIKKFNELSLSLRLQAISSGAKLVFLMVNFCQFHGPPGVIDKRIISRRAIGAVSRGQMMNLKCPKRSLSWSAALAVGERRPARFTFNEVTSEHA